VQHSPEGVKDQGLIVYEENFFSHDALLSAVFPAGCDCDCGGKAQGKPVPLVADARHAAGQETLTWSIGAICLGNQCRFVKTPILPMCMG
jgi:hypothetical protein